MFKHLQSEHLNRVTQLHRAGKRHELQKYLEGLGSKALVELRALSWLGQGTEAEAGHFDAIVAEAKHRMDAHTPMYLAAEGNLVDHLAIGYRRLEKRQGTSEGQQSRRAAN